jgi:hypothetical protein
MMENEMMIQGMSNGLFTTGIILFVIMTIFHLLALGRNFKKDRSSTYFQYNVLKIGIVNKIIKKRAFQFVMQIFPVLLLFLILLTGLIGAQNSRHNIAPVMTWTVWWTLLIFDIVLFGRMWCMACPWYALSSWLKRMSFFKRKNDFFMLNIKWPEWLSNIYPAVFLFIVFTWLELGFNVTASPLFTAVLGIVLTGLVFGSALVFDRMSFCRYGCMVGRICGLYGMFAPVEIRQEDNSVCRSCKTRDCLNGNDSGYPCPTSQSLSSMKTNTYCTVCSECFKSCRKDNVALNVRPFGADLLRPIKPKMDEASMALVMMSLTLFHGLTMTRHWESITALITDFFGSDYILSFTFGMAAILIVPIAVFHVFSWLTKYLADNKNTNEKQSDSHPFMHYAYALIPIILFFHLAHNANHLAAEGMAIVPALSDPFGWGWDMIGTASWKVRELLSHEHRQWLQLLLVSIGYYYSMKTCCRISGQRYSRKAGIITSAFIMSLAIFLFSLISLWLLVQPMIMRTMV